MRPGRFATVEGLDGCGKTTQMARLAGRLRAAGYPVVETAEPGGTQAGRAIRAILLDPRQSDLSARAELLLYFASRAQNVEQVIRPALSAGSIVLCDRFTDSTIVYQGAGRGIEEGTIRELHAIACGTLYPGLTVLLDIDPETSLARARQRNVGVGSGETRLDDESWAFFQRVRDGYLRLAAAEPERIKVVDARGDEQCVAGRVWAVAKQFVEEHD